jgi:HlyD family secretion protein
MKGLTRKRLFMIGGVVVVLALLVYAFLPKPVPVEVAAVSRGPFQVTVEEEGKTDVAEWYAVTAPVTAYLERVDLEVGDTVQRGQPIVTLEPPHTPILDPRAHTEAEERVRAARATADQAASERDRIQRLADAEAATRQQLDQAIGDATRAAADLAAAEAALRRTEGRAGVAPQRLTSPITGRVLAVRRRSAGQVNPGDTLLVVGDPRDLEVDVDVLSEDAVRMRPGTRVLIDQWGGDGTLEATVHRVEPQGFTKVSSLGVEEQRVRVVATLTSPPETWSGLGSGYRVLARFIMWEGSDVTQAPSSALFRVGEGWAAFVVEEGRARRRMVEVGRQGGLSTQILGGLQQGDTVIVHPGSDVADGTRVRP